MTETKKKRQPQKLPKIIDKEGVQAMLDQINLKCPTGCRNYAILLVMYRAGLRVGEVCSLTPRDVNLETGTIYVQQGKGKKDRYTYMDEIATEACREWAEIRPDSKHFFTTLKCTKMDPRYIRDLCYRLSRKAGVFIQDGAELKPVSPHKFRHTFATELINENELNIREIQTLLGHASINTTMVYTHVCNEGLAAKIRSRAM